MMVREKKAPLYFGESHRRIVEHYSVLRKSEKKIADHVLQDPDGVIHVPITELARRLDISEASISRFCRSIGYRGYNDFKIGLAKDTFAGSIKNAPAKIKETDDTATVIRKTTQFFIDALRQIPEVLGEEGLSAATRAIIQANKVQIYGVGGDGAIARVAQHVLLKAGIASYSFDDAYLQIIAAATLGKGDVAIGISDSGTTTDVVNAVTAAGECGATTIGITSNPRSPLAMKTDILLQTASEANLLHGEFMRARIGQLFIVDLLYIGVVFGLGERAVRNLEHSAEAIIKYYNGGGYEVTRKG
jgi:RpiR family carbohydrate utilization transcriptional regulator